jgi:hypothetical protein
MPRWRVPAERALGATVAKDADFYRAIGRRPPRYLLGAIRSEGAALPRRAWRPHR